jgi:hypothetical protein
VRDLLSALSRQLSAKSWAISGRVLLAVLATCSQLAPYVFAADDCTHRTWKWEINKKAAQELQQSVNEGHQPWRLEDVVAIAQEAINSRKVEWGDGTLILGVPKLRGATGEGTELVVAATENNLLPYHIAYFVTVRKFPWLKDSGQDASSIIWIATEVERVACPGPVH